MKKENNAQETISRQSNRDKWSAMIIIGIIIVIGLVIDIYPRWKNRVVVAEARGNTEDIDSANDDYEKQDIALTVYEIPLSGSNVVVEPDKYGDCPIEMGKVYALYWDATPLYRNRDAKVKADVSIYSDFLIKENGTGTMSVCIIDRQKEVVYSDEISVVSTSGNLGIEFCAGECKRRAYGFYPEIEDGEFYVCFYTSGEFVEHELGGVSGADGTYHYEYGAIGSEDDGKLVTKAQKKSAGHAE